ncbi:MAG: ABC transporter ATP-binding protein [Candidatus Adlerbacteria bacterium]|nr:ABC transporter ATP-binding protein [Candidatus Adlerbacteria bacterium]
MEKVSSPGIFSLLKNYRGLIGLLVILTIVGNALNLWLPKIMSAAIDSFARAGFSLHALLLQFFFVAFGMFVLAYLQSVVQTYASERVARDLRTQVVAKISVQEYSSIQKATPAKLLTNLTSDVDAVKTFVSQAIASIISSVFLIVGASVLLLMIDWKLALAVLLIIPIIGGTFFVVLSRVRKLFRKSQEAIDWLNKVINESILGAALIRLVNSQMFEYEKFLAASTQAKTIGFSILRMFAILIPVIMFSTNLATLVILVLGGHFLIVGSMTLGGFTAFTTYLGILIFPILIIGFMSNVIAQATASYARIVEVLNAPHRTSGGTLQASLKGEIEVKNITVQFGEKAALKDVSFTVSAGSKVAIIGPTAGGKTQLLYTMVGLLEPTSGTVSYDNKLLEQYDKQSLHEQVGFVFQDSSIFNLTLRENIAFSNTVTDESLQKAIDTAELGDFIGALPQGLNTVVSERGTSLSGGQKQRIMLARALALDPKILLLDDFTARVDTRTEQKILANVAKNYPGLTLVSVTQKIASVEHYDQILLLMEGELLAQGTHAELLETSPEYAQIYESQASTNTYEVHA